MSNGHHESGDHQSVFSTTTTTAGNFYPNDLAAGSFLPLPYSIDSGDPYFNDNRMAYYPATVAIDDRNSFYNATSVSDYQMPISPPVSNPEVSFQYLKELETDKWFLASLAQTMSPPCFIHASKLLDDEIARVEAAMGRDLVVSVLSDDKMSLNDELPAPEGEVINLEEKVVVPVDTNPEYNFIGRMMGPRGMTIKRLEQETGCRLLVRGRGSIKNPIKEESLRRKPGFEHLNENLHILVQAKDSVNRVHIKLARGVDVVKQMLTPVANDELKQRQMRELAIINGTYRPVQRMHPAANIIDVANTTAAEAIFYDPGQNFF